MTITFTIFSIIYLFMVIMLIALLLRQVRTSLPQTGWATVTAINPAEESIVTAKQS